MQAISAQRIQRCVEILNTEDEKPIIKRRLEGLSFQLMHLLAEIEEYSSVVYCGGAAACWLDNGVLKILSGSTCSNDKRVDRDTYFSKPSPAAKYILGRESNGWTEWKDSLDRSMKELSGRD